jgi:hypothetical protein
LGRHEVASQKNPVRHWASLVQAVPHDPFWQVCGAQLRVTPALQAPLPSQVLAAVSVDPLQLPGAHSLPATYRRQAPAPSQVPSSPQVAGADSAHWSRGSSPAGTDMHAPSLPVTLQLTQAPVHSALQQTPSTQKPLPHWPPCMHARPLPSGSSPVGESPSAASSPPPPSGASPPVPAMPLSPASVRPPLPPPPLPPRPPLPPMPSLVPTFGGVRFTHPARTAIAVSQSQRGRPGRTHGTSSEPGRNFS